MNRLHSYPFICQKMPFVGRSYSNVIPFVSRNIPFVGKYYGFTIIELLVTLSVLAILLTIAGPSLVNFVKNNRLVALTNDLVSDLNFSRNEAIKQGVPVSICASANPADANPNCSGSSDWSSGRLIFVDNNGSGGLDSGEAILRRQTGATSVNTLRSLSTSIGIYTYTATARITFDARGQASTSSGNPVLFAICDDRSATTNPPWKQVEVLPSGLIRSGALNNGGLC